MQQTYKLSKLTKEKLINLQNGLITDQNIANVFGVTRQYVHQQRKKLGIPTIGKKRRNAEICKMFKASTVEAVADMYELSIAQVYKIVRDMR